MCIRAMPHEIKPKRHAIKHSYQGKYTGVHTLKQSLRYFKKVSKGSHVYVYNYVWPAFDFAIII